MQNVSRGTLKKRSKMFHVKHQQKQKAKCFTWNIKKSRKKNASCETPAKAEGKMFHVEH